MKVINPLQGKTGKSMILTDDIAKTILAGCYKFGAKTLLSWGGDND